MLKRIILGLLISPPVWMAAAWLGGWLHGGK